MNYYDEKILEIKTYINENKFQIAESIIKEELSLPYIDEKIELELNDLLYEIRLKTSKLKSFDIKEIEKKLLSNDDFLQKEAILFLNKINIRNILEIIKLFFLKKNKTENKVLIIHELNRQNINDDFKIKINNKEITINPSNFNFSNIENKILLVEENIIKILYAKKQPSIIEISKQILWTVYFETFFETDFSFFNDIDLFADSIVSVSLLISNTEEQDIINNKYTEKIWEIINKK